MSPVPEESASIQTHDDSIETEPTLPSDIHTSTERDSGLTVDEPKRAPKVKLSFVNGQFVDMATEEGQHVARQAAAAAEMGAECADGLVKGAIIGVDTFIHAGHSGVIAPLQTPSGQRMNKSVSSASSSPRHEPEKRNSLPTRQPSQESVGGKKKGRFAKTLSRLKSDSSDVTVSSFDSENSFSLDGRDTVTSITTLGNGYFLTASKYDRVIKMWKIASNDKDGLDAAASSRDGGEKSIVFVRDFIGHCTGITCLAKVDDKGRFLSAGKDRSVKLWDSRFNCNDDEHGNSNEQVLLATFENMDRRSLDSIVITNDGHYVRPTDDADWAMFAAATKKAMKEGSAALTRAANERRIIGCSCEFAAISGRHKIVKVWSMKHLDKHPLEGGNMAEVTLEQELDNEVTVESIASMPDKNMILAGDRMGDVRLWCCGKNVFLPGSSRQWTCQRIFSWRLKSGLSTVEESMQYAVTSLSFLEGNTMFVCGSRSGNLRVWNVDGTNTSGETISKESIGIMGAHNSTVTAIKKGPIIKDASNGDSRLTFSSSSEDGKVLSFAVSYIGSASHGVNKERCKPCCFNAVNHGIVERYLSSCPISVTGLEVMPVNGSKSDHDSLATNVLISGSSCGNIHVLKTPSTTNLGQQKDALVLYRQQIEEEALTLLDIAEHLMSCVESRDRKRRMTTYKNCFLGSDAVSYMVDNGYAVSRKDALDLGRVLAEHFSLFQHVEAEYKLLEDDGKSFYRFSEEFGIESGAMKYKKSV